MGGLFMTDTAGIVVDPGMGFNPALVMVSFAVAFFGSYAALFIAEMFSRVTDENRRASLTLCGACALGCGIWSMHFVGMLAYHTDMQIHYDPLITAASLVIEVLCAYGAFSIVRSAKLTIPTLVASSIVLGVGISAMHYTGMLAMTVDAQLRYDPVLFALSVAIGIGASAVALFLFFHLGRLAPQYLRPARVACAGIMAVAICGLHYVGMEAAILIPNPDCRYAPDQNFTGLGIAVVLITVSLIGGSLYAAFQLNKAAMVRLGTAGYIYQQYFPPFIAILIGLCFAVYSGIYLGRQNEARLQSEASLLTRDLQRQIEVMTDNMTELRSFYRSSLYVDKEEFRTFLQTSLDRITPIQGFYFIPAIEQVTRIVPSNEFRSYTRPGTPLWTEDDFASAQSIGAAIADSTENKLVTLERFSSMPDDVRRDDMALASYWPGNKRDRQATPAGYFITIIHKASIFENFAKLAERRGLKVRIAATESAAPPPPSKTLNAHTPYVINSQFVLAGITWQLQYSPIDPPFVDNPIEFLIPLSIFTIALLIAIYTHLLLAQRQHDARAKRELLAAKLAADRANAAKSDFLANMSHEIRSPMNSVLGLTDMLLKTSLNAEQRSWAEIVKKSGEGLLSIINDILDFSKIEAEKLILEHVSFDVTRAVLDVCDMVSLAAQEKNLDILVDIAPNVPHTIKGDPARFRQILLNLMTNAVKFTSGGHILISIDGTMDDGRFNMTVAVEDTGIGIAPEKQVYIFEKFSQEEESTTRRFGGTGLGLAICRGLAELMGGKLELTSVRNVGSRFFFRIPVEPGDPRKADYLPDVYLNGIRALIIDNYGPARANLAQSLGRYGVECFTATNITEAVNCAKRANDETRPFDYIFADYDIGSKKISQLRALIPDATRKRCMFLTGGIGAMSSASTLEAEGVVGYLSKPILPEQLAIALKMAMNAASDVFITRTAIDNILFGVPRDPTCEDKAISYAGYNVMVVDDMKVNQMIMNKVLGEYGCNIEMATNGREAVEKIAGKKFDVVFMDCHMPEMDGFEATQVIRNMFPDDPDHPVIIALTADAMTGDREKCLKAGMNDYLNKPFKAEQIGDMLKKWIV